jgi:hypothetical protein
MTHHPVIRKRIAELQLELEAQTERGWSALFDHAQGNYRDVDGDHHFAPEKARLDNPLCEVRYVGKEGRMVAAFPDKHRCMKLLTKLMGWPEPTQVHASGGYFFLQRQGQARSLLFEIFSGNRRSTGTSAAEAFQPGHTSSQSAH